MTTILMLLMTFAALVPQLSEPRGRVTFADGTVVNVEIAATEPARQRGLMFRKSLAETAGMIFVFDRADFYPFWMQNCVIALDIIWVDEASRIVSIAANVPPCRKADCEPPCAAPDCPTYAPKTGTTAKYVVEVQAGFTSAHKVAVGQRVTLDLPAKLPHAAAPVVRR
jgi:uncharacterized membrane protein (UPF0127 family)